jgi:transposase
MRESSVSGWTARCEDVPLRRLIAVPVDVGKSVAVVMACDFAGRVVMPAMEFELNREGVAGMLARLQAALPAGVVAVRVGIEAAGHYHLVLTGQEVWPPGWEIVELNPAHVSAQRRVNGTRGVKTDRIDLDAMADMLLAGRGVPIVAADQALIELSAWAAHRRRRVQVRTGTKNQLLGQLDRAFPGVQRALPDVLGTKVGRLVAEHFSDPQRLTHLGAERFRSFAAHRGVRVSGLMADKLLAAAKGSIPGAQAAIARQVLAADLRLLVDLDAQINDAESQLAALLPQTEYAVLATVPGWGVVRVSNYAAAAGPSLRWASAAKLYRASGLTPNQYESAGKRRDGGISREGSVHLRQALLDLGTGLWLQEPAARTYAGKLRDRGKPGGIICCALAKRASKIAFAMVRDQASWNPTRWR